MKTLKLYVGIGFDALAFVRSLLGMGIVAGATVTESHGFWTDDTGKLWDEPGHVLTFVVGTLADDGHEIILEAKSWALQQGELSVMVEHADAIVRFEDAEIAK
jgi:hypothetical protein